MYTVTYTAIYHYMLLYTAMYYYILLDIRAFNQRIAIWAATELKFSPLNAEFKTKHGRAKRARAKNAEWKRINPPFWKVGGARPRYGGRAGARARARARALSRKSKARNQQNLENFNGNLSFDQREKLFSFSFSTKRDFRKYRSCPSRGERTTFWSSYLKTHQKIILFQIRSDDQNPRRETGGLISKLHVVRRKHQNQGFPNTYKTTYPPSWAHPGAPWGSLGGPWALPAAPKRTLKFFARILIF